MVHFAYKGLAVWDGEDTSIITIAVQLARMFLHNGREHTSVCRLCQSRCDHDEVADSTSVGWFWYFCNKTILAEHGRWLLLWLSGILDSDLCRLQTTKLTFDKCLMNVAKKMFEKWANHIHDIAVDRDNSEHDVWVVPALLRTLSYMKDHRDLPEYRTQSLSVSGVFTAIIWSSMTHVLETDQLNSSLTEFCHPSFSKHGCWPRVVLQVRVIPKILIIARLNYIMSNHKVHDVFWCGERNV